MRTLLAKLWRWIKSWFTPVVTTPPVSSQPQPKPELSDLEYENLFLAFLEEVDKGKSWGQLQGFLIGNKLDKQLLAQWLSRFGKGWLDSPETHQELARKLAKLGDVAQGNLGEVARSLSEELGSGREELAEIKQVEGYYERWLDKGYDLHQLGKYEEEIASYDRALAIKSDYYQAWYNRGIALSDLGCYEEAIASYEQALVINTNFYQAWINQGHVLKNLGRYEEAIANYDRALVINANLYQAWGSRGIALNHLGRYEEAIANYDRALAINPDYDIAWNSRGMTLSDLGRYEEAIASYDQALAINANSYQAWYNRGMALSDLGRYEEAIASSDKALAIKSDYYQAWNSRGVKLRNLGRYEEAIASSDKALAIQPNDYISWLNRGNVLDDLGRYEEAIASYDQALAVNTNFYQAWSNRGNALRGLKRYEEAIACYDQALAINYNDHLSWYNRSVAAFESNVYYSSIHQQFISSFLNKRDPRLATKTVNTPSHLNLQLNKRGYEGQIISLETGLEYIKQETHPEGWGILHHQIGKAHYRRSKNHKSPHSFRIKAKNSYEDALKTLTATNFPQLHLEVLKDFIILLIDLQEIDKARELQRQGTDLLNRLLADEKQSQHQKQQLARKFASFAQITVDLTVQSGNITEALEIAEKGKNTCLRWLLDTAEIPQVSFLQMQQLLDDATAIVYWHLSPSSITTFVILSSESAPLLLENEDLPEIVAWENWLSNWNKQYDNYNAADQEGEKWRGEMESNFAQLKTILCIEAIEKLLLKNSEQGQKYTEKILEKDVSKISKIENLLLIPHRDLHRLPLHYLFEKFTCSYLPSAQLGLKKNKLTSLTPFQNLLIVENPPSEVKVKGKKLSGLPYAEVEAALIRQHFSPVNTIANEKATKTALEQACQQSYQVLHFAGHGGYNSVNPAESCLFLNGKDQFTLLDILKLNLKGVYQLCTLALLRGVEKLGFSLLWVMFLPQWNGLNLSAYQLVSLAACETAVTGNQTITDEYVGLVSAFLKAGANYVISTLWTVESAATMMLMVEFYDQLSEGKSPAVALRMAQTWLKNATKQELQEWLQEKMTTLSDRNSDRLLIKPLKTLKNKIATIQEHRPYNHPYYWSAFHIAGQ